MSLTQLEAHFESKNLGNLLSLILLDDFLAEAKVGCRYA